MYLPEYIFTREKEWYLGPSCRKNEEKWRKNFNYVSWSALFAQYQKQTSVSCHEVVLDNTFHQTETAVRKARGNWRIYTDYTKIGLKNLIFRRRWRQSWKNGWIPGESCFYVIRLLEILINDWQKNFYFWLVLKAWSMTAGRNPREFQGNSNPKWLQTHNN